MTEREALLLIRGTTCRSFTTGLGSCFLNGRTPDAKYLADRCCDSCIAHEALSPVIEVSARQQMAMEGL